MILITTTRRPSRRTRSFVRDLYHVLPASMRRNRGKMSMEDLNELAIREGVERVIVVGTQRGNPSFLAFYEPSPSHLKPISLVRLEGVSLRREITDKRAPQARKLGIAYSSGLENEARVMAKSLNAYLGQGMEELRSRGCEVALLLSSDGGIRATFYRLPAEELGPRMRISEIREYAEGVHGPESEV